MTGGRAIRLILGGVFLILAASAAEAQLLIVPQRVVFEARERSTTINLVNQSDRTTTYRIVWRELTQLPSGDYRELEPVPADAKLASGLVRYSPRQVTLQPNEQQVVRLLVRRPGNLADGEYRSHMLFEAEPIAVGGAAESEAGIGVQLQVVYGISIPVIVRVGDLGVSAGLERPAVEWLDPRTLRLSVAIARVGDKSLYGDIDVLIRDAGGERQVLQNIRGLAVYPPNDHREARLDIAVPEGLSLKGRELEVVFRSAEEEEGEVLATTTVRVP